MRRSINVAEIWYTGDSEHARKVHLVSWKEVCLPKKQGGLGLHSARNMNKVSMMKAGWQLCMRRQDLCVEVVRAKYKCGPDMLPRIVQDKPGSNL